MGEPPVPGQIGCFVAGRWLSSGPSERVAVVNPATGDPLADIPPATGADAVRAVEAADDALTRPVAAQTRVGWLRAVEAGLLERRDRLGRLITAENGKPLRESVAEVEYAAGFFADAAEQIHALDTHAYPTPARGCDWRVERRPLVCGLITPWNFPLSQAAKKVAAALGAASPLVLKPAEATPLSAIALFEILLEAGVDPGRIHLLIGDAREIGSVLATHPAVRLLSFTGSTAVGQLLIRQTAPHVKKLAMELGGNAPLVVFDDADLDNAVDALVASKFRASGQTCVCPNRVLVHADVHDAFVDALAARLESLRVGDGADPETDLGPLIGRDAWDKVHRLDHDARAHGARPVLQRPRPRPEHDFGAFYEPTLLTGLTPGMACWREEVFGPLVAVATFDTEPEAIRMANDTDAGLAAYVCTADPERARRAAAGIQAGHVAINSGTGPVPFAPFGGMRQSGFGREGSAEALLEFTDAQTVATARGE